MARLPSVSRGFARLAVQINLLIAMVVIAAFAITTERVTRISAKKAAVERARVCAASLVPGPNGELWPSVDELQDRYKPLAAVATLDSIGNLQVVYPNEPHLRAAVAATLEAGGGPLNTGISVGTTGQTLWGVVAPLNEMKSPAARRVVLLLAGESHRGEWLSATYIFGLVAVLNLSLGLMISVQWFRSHVTRPLRNLSTLERSRGFSAGSHQTIETGGWRETQRVADTISGLLAELSESSAEYERLELEGHHRLAVRQKRFDRKLRRAEDQAMTDRLTGLRNRAFLESELESLVARHRAGGESFSVVMIDVDNFKAYNDANGHKAGDDLLRFIGELLQGTIRPTDHAVRYGGDEFLLLFPGMHAIQAVHTAERITKLFTRHVSQLDGGKRLSMSAGVADLESCTRKTGDEMVIKADAALYTTKRAGKNAVTCSAAG